MVKKTMYQRIVQLKLQGYPQTEIAERLDIDRKTVRKYCKMSEERFRECRQSYLCREKSFASYKEEILEIYRNNDFERLPMSSVYDYLEELHGELPGTEKTLRNYIHYLYMRNQLEFRSPQRCYRQVAEQPYGRQLQVDFGEYRTRSRCKLYIFAAVLASSRYKYVRFQDHPFRTLEVIAHLLSCFDCLGGMPEELVIDQDSILVVAENHGDIIYAKEFSLFIEEMGLKMYVCRKADPESKGKIENVIKFVKYNFLASRDFEDVQEANKSLAKWLKRRANGKLSQATKRIPAEMFEEERDHLRPIRNSIFRKDSLQGREERQADDKSMISVSGSQYSVPTKYKNKVVEIYKTETALFIFDIHSGEQIYCHDVSLVPGQKVIAREHFRQKDKSARELKQEVLSQFSFLGWKSFAEHNFKAFPRYVRDQCLLAQKYFDETADLALLEHAVGFCLTNKTFSMKDLADTYRFYKSWAGDDTEEDEEEEDLDSIQLRNHALKHPITVAQRDLEEYTALLKSSSGGQS
jgi:transposase